MTKHREILNFIYTIKQSHPLMVEIFTKGSCLNFHLILKKVYPEAEAYDNIEHVITKIGKYYYDINGVVHDTKGYSKLTNGSVSGIKQMMDKNKKPSLFLPIQDARKLEKYYTNLAKELARHNGIIFYTQGMPQH